MAEKTSGKHGEHPAARSLICGYSLVCFCSNNDQITTKKEDAVRLGSALYFYACRYPAGFSRASSESAAISSAVLIAWLYMLPVVLGLAWPRRPATVRMFVPPAISSVAFVWRRECAVIGGSPRLTENRFIHLERELMQMGFPFG